MFENLQDRLQGVFDQLARRGRLSEADVDKALREVRLALLEAALWETSLCCSVAASSLVAA